MSLTQKIWLLVTIPFMVTLGVYLAATRPFRRELLLTEAARDARDDVVVLQSAIAKGLVDEQNQIPDLMALTESIAQAERIVGLAVFSSRGNLVAASSGVRDDPRIGELARLALSRRQPISELREAPTRLEHAFLLEHGGRAAVAVVVRDVGYVDALVWSWTKNLIVIGAGFVVVMLLASKLLVRRIVGIPLDAVVGGVERVAAGSLEVHVPDVRDDELGRLARSFNEMTESLRAARARAEAEGVTRAALEARMRHIQTLAAAGEVAASLAHEIGSPLNVILGRTRMMAARDGTPDATRRDLEIVAQQTERITRVVRKLLEISRPSRGRIEEVDLRSVVEETLAFVAPECKKRGITSAAQVSEQAGRVLADRDQLVQIVFNLCHNAIQAQPQGGRLDVGLARRKDELSGAPFVEITVSDAGPGVDPEVRGRIFDPFVTTKRGEGGTGLGLAIVDGMVRELGGRVEVDDAPGGGACFRVLIPAVARDASHRASAPPEDV